MSNLVSISKFRKNGLMFLPTSEGKNYDLPIELTTLFEQNERNGFRVFAIDLKHIPSLTEEMVALLIETTVRLRRKGGDLYTFNLHSRLQEDLSAFNVQAFLSVARSAASPAEYEAPKQESQSKVPADHSVSSSVGTGLRKEVSEINISFSEDQVYKVCDFVVKEAEQFGFSPNELSRMRIATYEACLNAVQHSNKTGFDESMTVEVEKIGDLMQINVYDQGRGFNVEKTLDYDVTEAASHRKTGGMGLHIIRKAMDTVDYEMDPIRGNKLVMKKYLKH